MRTVFSAKKKIIATPEAIEIGGTSATTAIDALLNLEGVSNTQKDIPNGVAVLGNNLKIKLENMPAMSIEPLATVDGIFSPQTVSTTRDFVITNYDTFRTYTLTAIAGTVQLNTYDDLVQCVISAGGDIGFNDIIPPSGAAFDMCKPVGRITYTAPATSGPGGFILNGVHYDLTIEAPPLTAPTITWPINNAVQTSASLAAIISGVDTTQYGLPAEYQLELAEDTNFTTNLQSYSFNEVTRVDTANIQINNLLVNKLYYLRSRMKYTDGNGGEFFSPWCDVVSFATDAVFLMQEIQELFKSPVLAGDTPHLAEYFGWNLDLSGDGQVLAIGVPQYGFSPDTPRIGSVELYHRQGDGTYAFATSTTLVNPAQSPEYISTHLDADYHRYNGAWLGETVRLSQNKQYLFATANNFQPVGYAAGCGAIAIFKSNTPGDWGNGFTHLEDLVQVPPTFFNGTIDVPGGFGWRIAISKTTTNIYFAVSNSYDYVYIYKLDTTTDVISLIQSIPSPSLSEDHNAAFGSYLSMTDNGQTLVIGANQEFVNRRVSDNKPMECGAMYVYQFNGTTFDLEQRIDPSDPSLNNVFGNVIAINHDGTEIVMADDCYDMDASLFIFRKNGSQIWELVQNIVPPTWLNYADAGASIAISLDGTKMIVGAISINSRQGCFIVFRKVNDLWETDELFTGLDSVANDWFGSAVGMSNDGKTYVASAVMNGDSGVNSIGSVYIFE